jgi:hypothetical protein
VIRIRIFRSHRVDCRATVHVPLSASIVWGQIRDFPRFACQEMFHAEMHIAGDIPRQGAPLQMIHRFLVFHVRRRGRICRWREGHGFAFSDLSLSPRTPRRGFPHIFSYLLKEISPAHCDVQIRVAGLWTARWIPRPLAWLWLRWVMQFAAQNVENELMLYRLWLQKNAGRKSRLLDTRTFENTK